MKNSGNGIIDKINFFTKALSSLTKGDIDCCNDLFTNHYGIWSQQSPYRPGQGIKLPARYFEKLQQQQNCHISMAYFGDELLGYAIFVKKQIEGKNISWVIQLVVHSDYRKQSIGKKLLYSVWGFSGDYAWGLATSNPFTVKTLESATFRKVSPSVISTHLDILRALSQDIAFAKNAEFKVNESTSLINSNFFIDHSSIPEKMEKSYKDTWVLGDLPEGHEWLAFTFQNQDVELNEAEMNNFLSFSEKTLKEAYGRMNMENHKWASFAESEIDFIIDTLSLSGNEIIADFGCGLGRHVSAFTKREFSIVGVDFSESNIEFIKGNLNIEHCLLADCRKVVLPEKCDLIICLYDVIGSFPSAEDNESIIKNIHRNVKKGGKVVASVMNMELAKTKAKFIVEDILADTKPLFHLKPSNIMQKTGNIFDPDFYLIEEKTGLIYRKEQFINDGLLSAEYLIRDKRYLKAEICFLFERNGFRILDVRFPQLGDWNVQLNSTHDKAKEILIIAEKI